MKETQFEEKSDFEKLVIAQHYINFLKKENKKLQTEKGGLISEIEHVNFLESKIESLNKTIDKSKKELKNLKKYYTQQAELNSDNLLNELIQRQKENITGLNKKVNEYKQLFKLCKQMKSVVYDVVSYNEYLLNNNEESLLYKEKTYNRMVSLAKEVHDEIKNV